MEEPGQPYRVGETKPTSFPDLHDLRNGMPASWFRVNHCSAREEDAMVKRPTSVSVVCWILIATGGILLIHSIWYLNNPTVKQITMELMSQSPIPIPLQYVMMYVGLLITAVSGIAMLGGRNWGRFLYVAWCILGFIIGFATSPMRMGMIPGLVLFIAEAVILFRPKANQYFSAGSLQNGVWPIFTIRAVTMRKVVGTICYILAGLFFVVACQTAFIKIEPTPEKFELIGLFMTFLIGLFMTLAIVSLFLGIWSIGFHKWQHYTGIVLLSASGLSTFAMFTRAFLVAPPEVEKYFPAETRVIFIDYFTGTACILALGLAGALFVISGRKAGLDQKSDQSWIQDKEATGSRSTGNGWKAMKGLHSEPKTQNSDHVTVRGVSIVEFSPGSSAGKAGMHKGDVIIEYGSERDVTIEKLSAVMAKRDPEAGQVRVVFMRDGQQYTQKLPSGPLGISAMNITINVPLKSE